MTAPRGTFITGGAAKDKTAHVGVVLPPGWTNEEVARVSDLNDIKDHTAGHISALSYGSAYSDVEIQAAINAAPVATTSGPTYYIPTSPGGSTVLIPRGDWHVYSQITLKHGVHIRGEGRDATRIISHVAGSVFKYADDGEYIARVVSIERLSIVQYSGVTATSGAAIEACIGTSSVPAIALSLRHVAIDSTYCGVILAAGIMPSFYDVDIRGCVSHGVYVKYAAGVPAYALQTTTTAFVNVYAHFNGGDGFRLESTSSMGFYCSGGDSNGGYGIYLDAAESTSFLACGAEGNTSGGVYLKNTIGTCFNGQKIVEQAASGTRHAYSLENAKTTSIIGGEATATGGVAGEGVHIVTALGYVMLAGAWFTGAYLPPNRSNHEENIVDIASTVSDPLVTPALKSGTITSTAANGANALAMTTGQRIDLGGGANDYLYSNGSAIRSPGSLIVDTWMGAVTFQFGSANTVTTAAAQPGSGAHSVGEIVLNTAPAAGGFVGWVCTGAGTPGTWKTFGAITP